MLDEYGLRLLAEIGVDVYAPRSVSPSTAPETRVPESSGADPAAMPATQGQAVGRAADVLILGSFDPGSRLLVDLSRAFRGAGLRAEHRQAADAAALPDARAVLVLGESLARDLGTALPAQRHEAIHWIITSDPRAVSRSASVKQGLWGEIKRLVRALRSCAAQA